MVSGKVIKLYAKKLGPSFEVAKKKKRFCGRIASEILCFKVARVQKQKLLQQRTSEVERKIFIYCVLECLHCANAIIALRKKAPCIHSDIL